MKSVLLADDLGNVSSSGKMRSHLIRDLAEEMSRRLQASLNILYVEESPKHFLTSAGYGKVKEQDDALVQELEKEMASYPVKSHIEAIEGDPVTTILEKEKSLGSLEMVVLGSQGIHGLEKALIGSVSEEILRHAKNPVMVLGPEARKREFTLPLDQQLRILVLTDLSEASLRAEEYAVSLAERLEAHLTFCYDVGHQIHQMKEMIYSRRISNVAVDDIFNEMRETGKKALTKRAGLAEKHKIAVGSLMIEEQEPLEKNIPKWLEAKYDLIVMGTHSRGKFLTAFLGSSARNLILKSPVPVIIVRSPEQKLH